LRPPLGIGGDVHIPEWNIPKRDIAAAGSESYSPRLMAEDYERITSILTGVAGEYFVAAELSRRGFIASITMRNSRGFDILATNENASRTVTIQVKTNQNARREWMLNDKAEKSFSKDWFYVFVILNRPHERPAFYVVPSEDVAKQISKSHRAYLGTAGRMGQQRKDSPMRKFFDAEDHYLERWDLLGLHPLPPESLAVSH
jgi:hypothetical protein